jgi:peptidoglycan/LPS O-acetylase OafA/YrhL
VALIFVVLAWRCYLVFGVGLDYLPHYRLYKATDTRFDAILYGVLFALIAGSSGFRIIVSSRLALFFGYALLLSSFFFRSPEFRESFRYSVQGLGLLLVFGNLIDSKSHSARLLRSGVFRFFGKISYSLYLYHWLIFVLVQHYFGGYPFVIRVALMLPLSVFLGWVSYRWVERPGLQFGRHFIASRNF